MRSFEERFAAIGARLDRVIERLRERRPRRFERRSGPGLREQAGERVRDAREYFAEGRWKHSLWVDDRSRRRVYILGGSLLLAIAVAVPWALVRRAAQRPSLQELMDQAMVQARMELAAQGGDSAPVMMGSWGAGPGAGARAEPVNQRRWGP